MSLYLESSEGLVVVCMPTTCLQVGLDLQASLAMIGHSPTGFQIRFGFHCVKRPSKAQVVGQGLRTHQPSQG